MKKFFAFVAVASLAVAASAQNQADLEAKKADIENQLANYDDGIAKKWELRLDGTFATSFGKGDGGLKGIEDSGEINVGVGYNFKSNFYAGLASGYFLKIGRCKGVDAPSYVPALLDLTYRWNLGTTEKWSVFLQGRGGYLFSTNGDYKLSAGKNYSYENALYLDIQPGVYYRIKRNIDLKFSVGYAHLSPSDDTPDMAFSTNMLVAKLGVNFRSAPKMACRSELEETLASVNTQLEDLRLAAEEAARQAALKAAQEEAARKAAAEAAARKAAEEEAARLAALEAAKHQNLVLFYELRESDLNADKNAKLQELAEWAKSRQIDKIVIKGYADRGTGNPRINVGYAKNRAEKVKKALIKNYGIDKNMIECTSFGDTEQPFDENDQNRCAVILVNQVD